MIVMRLDTPQVGYVGTTDDVIRRLDISDGPRVALYSGGTVV